MATKTETVEPIETTDQAPASNLRLHKVSIKNLMRLTGVEVTFDPEDHLVIVGGRNAQGKSSFLDGIAAAFQKGKPSDLPIHAGARKADETIILADDSGTPVYAITKTYTKSGTECTVIDLATGEALPDARALLDDLTAKGFGFDPALFARQGETAAGRREQFETLRALTGLDFTALNEERARIYTERTGVNKVGERITAQLAAAPKYPDAPKAPVDMQALSGQHAAAVRQQADLVALREKFSRTNERRERILQSIAALQEDLDQVNTEVIEIKERGVKLRAEAVDPEPIIRQLEQAGETNRQIEANARHKQLYEELAVEVTKVDALTARIEEIDAEKVSRMKATAMPLPDLAFDDDRETVIYQGKPLTVASSAEKLRVSTAIGIAMLKQLKVILIREGSSLDRSNLRLIAEMAAAAGVQVLIEKVCIDGASFVIENGAIADEATIARLLEEENGKVAAVRQAPATA